MMIVFHRWVLRGIRSRKRSAIRLDAFTSPGTPPLAEIDDGPIRFRSYARRRDAAQVCPLRARFTEGVVHLCLTPGLLPEALGRWIASGTIRGLVLQAFGAGNIPSNGDYALGPVIHEAVYRRSIPVVLASPYDGERTRADYATGLAAVEAGAYPAETGPPRRSPSSLPGCSGWGWPQPKFNTVGRLTRRARVKPNPPWCTRWRPGQTEGCYAPQ